MSASGLPAFWEMKIDPGSGKPFFMDHKNRVTTWHDPRQTSQYPVATQYASNSQPYTTQTKQQPMTKPSLYPSTQELKQSLESLQIMDRNEEKPSLDNYYRQNMPIANTVQQNFQQQHYTTGSTQQEQTPWTNTQSSTREDIPQPYPEPDYGTVYSSYQQNVQPGGKQPMPLSNDFPTNQAISSAGTAFKQADHFSANTRQLPQQGRQFAGHSYQQNPYMQQYYSQEGLPVSSPNSSVTQQQQLQQQVHQPHLQVVQQGQFNQQLSTPQQRVLPQPHQGYHHSELIQQQQKQQQQQIPPSPQYYVPQQQLKGPTQQQSYVSHPEALQQMVPPLQQPVQQLQQRVPSTLQHPVPPLGHPALRQTVPPEMYSPAQDLKPQIPGQNYVYQPASKPPSSDSQLSGSYNYQPNQLNASTNQNYQPQMSSQGGLPISQAPGFYFKHGQPEQYQYQHGAVMNTKGQSHLYGDHTTQQINTSESPQSFLYQGGPNVQQGPQVKGGEAYQTHHQNMHAGQAATPHEPTGCTNTQPQQPYVPNQPVYSNSTQPYSAASSMAYQKQYFPNVGTYSRNSPQEKISNHGSGESPMPSQAVRAVGPLPTFQLTGSPSDVHITNINRILQQASVLVPQVEQFKGKRGTKEYLYLDGTLTGYILELDKIITDGYEEVQLARKSAIQSVQLTLNYLECKGF